MGYKTKIQLIKRQESEQWYINFPAALAQAIEFERGEIVEWLVESKTRLILKRHDPPLTEPPRQSNTGGRRGKR